MRKTVLIVIDGCAPDYLTPATAPNLFAMAREAGAFYRTVEAAVPTVTNVNHASILSGLPPRKTAVTGNYFYDRATGEQGFIESDRFMRAPTIFDRCRQAQKKTALLTVKGKVLQVFGAGADIKLSAQNPDPELLFRLGLPAPPALQTAEVNLWILEAALNCLKREDPDFLYCTTNDYPMHRFSPDSRESLEHIAALDRLIGRIHRFDPQRALYVTADHGMNRKTVILDLNRTLGRLGIDAVCIPPLKDRYIENHPYQEGGILYLYLRDPAQEKQLAAALEGQPGIAEMMTAHEAAARYELPREGIGDYVVFAAPDYAFGELDREILCADDVRTHGSLWERTVPLFAANAPAGPEMYRYSRDITANLDL